MFSIGAFIKGHRTLPYRWAWPRRPKTRSDNNFRPGVELLEGRALPSATPLSLTAPLAPIASIRVADAGTPMVITITIPIVTIAPAEHGVLIERFFHETFLLQPTGESSPSAPMSSPASPIPAILGRTSAPVAPEPVALTAIPPSAAVTPANPTTSGVGSPGTAPTAAFGLLPNTQAAPAPAPANFTTTESAPTAPPSSTAPGTNTATPLSSIGYFIGSDGTAEENLDQEAMPPAENNASPAATPPANAEPDRPIDAGPAPVMQSDDGDHSAGPVGPTEQAVPEDAALTSDRSIALAALAAGIGVSSVGVVSEDDESRKRRSRRRWRPMDV